MHEMEGSMNPVRAMEQAVPFKSVRLVYPLKDETTGVKRDVIIKKIVNTKIWFDRVTGRAKWQRMIPGLGVIIPWPKSSPKEHKNNDCDTLRMEVETKTFVPSLLRPPMPTSVIDELRNKYSIFRTRHDEEYIAAKMAEDQQKEEKKKIMEEMRTPLKEINRRERKLRKAKGKGTLTKEMLERIGEVIARKREAAASLQQQATPVAA
jgi:large subunit ribosomal protein L24